MFKIKLIGSYHGNRFEAGEAFVRSHFGSFKPNHDNPAPVTIQVSKERLLEILSDAIDIHEARITISFDDISLEVK